MKGAAPYWLSAAQESPRTPLKNNNGSPAPVGFVQEGKEETGRQTCMDL